MRENSGLTAAKSAKNDEFYTQFVDIQKEVNAYLEYNPDTFRGKTVLLNVRVFDEPTKKSVYAKQTNAVKGNGKSNCPLCAEGSGTNHGRIWKLTEMDADHVTAWSKGGATDISNCQMLCKTHNRMKGNR